MSTNTTVDLPQPLHLESPQNIAHNKGDKPLFTNVVASPVSSCSSYCSSPVSLPSVERSEGDEDALNLFKTSKQIQNRTEHKFTAEQINNYALKAQAIDAIRTNIYRATNNGVTKAQIETQKGHSFFVECLKTLPTSLHSAVEAEIRRECQTTKYRISINFQLGKIMLMK